PRLLEDPAWQRLLLHPGGAESGDPGPLGEGYPRGLVGPPPLLEGDLRRHLRPRPRHDRARARVGPVRGRRAPAPVCLPAGAVHLLLYVFVLAPPINGLDHWVGRKNFGNNADTNNRVLAGLTGGESLHNNHHAYPSSPKFSVRRSEFDPSWVVIKVLAAVRLI